MCADPAAADLTAALVSRRDPDRASPIWHAGPWAKHAVRIAPGFPDQLVSTPLDGYGPFADDERYLDARGNAHAAVREFLAAHRKWS